LILNKDPVIEGILQDYKLNQARFHITHKGNTLNGAGTVEEVRADVFGTGRMFFIDIRVGSSQLKCITESKESAAMLNKGQTISFSGIIDDVSFGILSLDKCIFR